MSFIVNTLYAVLTWMAAFVVGFAGDWGWLGWALLVMAVTQSWATIWQAGREL